MAYIKPQVPLKRDNKDYIYPLTTLDQVIDGDQRANSTVVKQNLVGSIEDSEIIMNNADALGGIPAENYITKFDISGSSTNSLLDIIYPVGSVYLTVNNVNPSTLFANTTWVLLSDKLDVGGAVFGNGISLGVYNGSSTAHMGNNDAKWRSATGYNVSVGGLTGSETALTGNIGIPTKQFLENNNLPLSSTGIVTDTLPIYIWQRTK